MTEDVAVIGKTSLRTLTLEDRMRAFDSQFASHQPPPEGSFTMSQYRTANGISWTCAHRRVATGIESGQIEVIGKFVVLCGDKKASVNHYRFKSSELTAKAAKRR